MFGLSWGVGLGGRRERLRGPPPAVENAPEPSLRVANSGSNPTFPSIGINEGHPTLPHHGGSKDKLDKIKKIDLSGRHLKASGSLCGLFLSMFDRMKIRIASFGDTSERLSI